MRRFLAPTLALALVAPCAVARAGGPLSEVTVEVQEDSQPVRDVLRRLEAQHGLNYVVSEETLANAGTVTVHLKQVPLDDALHAICAACGLSLEIRGRILILLPREGTRRAALPPVRDGVVPSEGQRDGGAKATPRSSLRVESMRAVGEVLEVDRPNGRLRLSVDGLKRDFYLPEPRPGEQAALARLEGAMARLAKGHRVALEYRREEHRAVIMNLVGGDKVRGKHEALAARPTSEGKDGKEEPAAKPEPKKGRLEVEGSKRGAGARTAPEGAGALPDGVLVGNFVSYAEGVVKVRRGDGEVISLGLISDPEQRAKTVATLEKLKPDAKVIFMLGEEGGQQVVKGGITDAR
ncbi:MAG: hypothetical protein AB7N76_14410 [Planctomycetota bacterium]